MLLKPTIPRCEPYLDFVRSKGCCICGHPAEAHHAVGRRGTGVKPSDYGTIPLCRRHHQEVHALGVDSFQKKHDVSFIEVVANLMHYERTGQPLTMVLR